MTRPIVRIGGEVQGGGGGGGGCTLPTFAASGNAGVPDPLKYYPLESDAVEAVDGDTPTVSGTISYAYSASLRRNVAYFDANAYMRYSAGNVADYRLAGEMSGMVYFETKSESTATAGKPVVAVQSAGDLEADNSLWSVLQTDSALSFFTEYGAGTNDDRVVTGVKLNAYAAWIYGWTRSADGVTVRHFINGAFVLETTAASAPTGGTTAEFIVQYAFALSREAKAIGQIAIWNSALTDAQMIAAHKLAAPALCGIC